MKNENDDNAQVWEIWETRKVNSFKIFDLDECIDFLKEA